jgi:hypothetical protein
MTTRSLIHDDDLVLAFDATQEARHAAVLRLNEMARAMVERSRANAAGQPADEDGVVPGPGRLRIVLGFDREDKSSKQRRFLHGPVLGQISEQASVGGIRYERQVWKEFLRKQFLPDKWESYRLPGAKRATPHRIRVSTESLSVKQYSELIDKVLAYAASELGVVFDLDPVEREEVRYVKPKRAAKQPALQNEVTA